MYCGNSNSFYFCVFLVTLLQCVVPPYAQMSQFLGQIMAAMLLCPVKPHNQAQKVCSAVCLITITLFLVSWLFQKNGSGGHSAEILRKNLASTTAERDFLADANLQMDCEMQHLREEIDAVRSRHEGRIYFAIVFAEPSHGHTHPQMSTRTSTTVVARV